MSTEPENLTLVYLRRLDAKLDTVIEGQRDHGLRLNRIEAEIGHLTRVRADDLEGRAHLQAQLDRLREEMERVKRRLDLTDRP